MRTELVLLVAAWATLAAALVLVVHIEFRKHASAGQPALLLIWRLLRVAGVASAATAIVSFGVVSLVGPGTPWEWLRSGALLTGSVAWIWFAHVRVQRLIRWPAPAPVAA